MLDIVVYENKKNFIIKNIECINLSIYEKSVSVVEIGNAAFFANEELEEVIIPASVEKIGVQAFDRCKNLKEIVTPNSVATIGVQAFKDCTSLTYVRIGKNVADVGLDTFSGCSSLKEIAVHKDNVDYESVDGNLYLSSSISNMETLVQYAIGKAETSFSVPDGVVHIRSYAFTNSKLENIILPDSLKSVGGFYNCSKLISVTIPESVVSVGNFAGSTNLRTVTLPSGLKYVPSFMGCSSLESLVIPENVTKIGQNTFKDCAALTSITIPLHVVKIGITAFSGCKNLTRVVFENTAYWTAECAGRDTVEFTKAELSDPETAAKYLTDTYRYYDWAQ